MDDHREAVAALERGEPDLAETRTARLEKRLDELLAAMGKKRGDLDVERKSDPWKVALAAEMKAGTTATNQWLADALAMGSPFQVSRLASACRAEPGAAAPFLRPSEADGGAKRDRCGGRKDGLAAAAARRSVPA